MPDEPNMFPNQPKIEEHIAKHQTEDSPFAPKIIKVTDVATRLKILEERYTTLRKKMLLAEQNIIESEKNHFQEIRLLNDTIMELKKKLKDSLEKVNLLSDEINNFASRTDFITLQRYVEFWNPMDFVSRKEINDFLRKKLGPKSPNKSSEKKDLKKDSSINSKKSSVSDEDDVSIENVYSDTD